MWELLCSHTSCSAWGMEQFHWKHLLVFFGNLENSPQHLLLCCWWQCGLAWQVLGWACPCAGKILKLRVKVAGWEVGSVLKHSSLRLALVRNTSGGLRCLQGCRGKGVAFTPSPAIQPEPPRAEAERWQISLSPTAAPAVCLSGQSSVPKILPFWNCRQGLCVCWALWFEIVCTEF